MKRFTCLLLVAAACASEAHAQRVARDVPYATTHERQVLDVYAPEGAKNLPVVFWIHGGGWQSGDKGMVAQKPKAFTGAGFVFVSINHRLLPTVDMGALTRDVASALGWVHKNIATHGGDPTRLLVMGHSSGGQLAALMCTDDRYAKAEGVSLTIIKGCVPVDADTFDIPAIIEMAETRARVHRLSMPTYGHRQQFGDDPAKQRDFSAVTVVAVVPRVGRVLALPLAQGVLEPGILAFLIKQLGLQVQQLIGHPAEEGFNLASVDGLAATGRRAEACTAYVAGRQPMPVTTAVAHVSC